MTATFCHVGVERVCFVSELGETRWWGPDPLPRNLALSKNWQWPAPSYEYTTVATNRMNYLNSR